MRRRGGWSLWAGVIYVVILAAVTAGLASLYTRSRDRLDEAMGARLLAVAQSLAVMLDQDEIFAASLGDPAAAGYFESISDRLRRAHDLNGLAEITLSSRDGQVLFSTLPSLVPGAPNDYWELDQGAAKAATAGVGQASKLYRLEETFQKSAYAPVVVGPSLGDDPVVVAVITVSGNPDFFDSLSTLRRAAWITGGAVLLVLVLLGLFLQRIHLSLEHYRASMLRQENLAAMGRMTAGIAHEIRNPLGIIRGTGQHLQRVLSDAGIEDEMAEFIPEEVDRLDRILSGYLAFGTDRPAPAEVFDLARAVGRGVQLLESELAGANVHVELEAAGELPVLGDPRRLQQVILNLVLNARDAMPDGGVIRVLLSREEETARVRVADEGCGLQGSDPERLFEPFTTSKEKGSGLGLALSRRIVEEMGGELWLRERSGGGVEAALTLPLHMVT